MAIPRSKSAPALEIPSRTIIDVGDPGMLNPPAPLSRPTAPTEEHEHEHHFHGLLESEEDESVSTTPKSLQFGLEEQTKKEEDKLGILHLADLLAARAQSRPDEHLLSPYTGDQPGNDDALYNGLRALRCAHSTDAQKAEDYQVGALFLSGDEQRLDKSSWVSSFSRWLSTLYGTC
ncbi:hypothetical protein NEOLEDRAFT_1237837 [Neolentinus lepideus HHB14362 ss-1]|uniref:Uncharacterized protein n=1 Tax=Neolentinus lepideus HHB14362 ss-1 TaxID=1314782 RepID=A0A165W399_9AGAM|nr:hypothetical protein NEOLEDRAFT_1237837 [Neolentinus lepideus HHB14362 ss-1]